MHASTHHTRKKIICFQCAAQLQKSKKLEHDGIEVYCIAAINCKIGIFLERFHSFIAVKQTSYITLIKREYWKLFLSQLLIERKKNKKLRTHN
jgi:hypothetical protein